MNTPGGHDRLYASLNPLVMDGTLTPQQADRVYSAVGGADRGVRASGETVAAGWDRSRLFAALTVLAAGLLATAYLVASVVNGVQGTEWKSTTLLLGTAVFLGAAAAVWLLLLEGNAWATWVSGALGAVALAGLTLSVLILGSDGSDALVYVTGLLMLAGGAAGFWFLEGQLYAVVAVLGGMLVLGQIFSDTLDSDAGMGDALTVGIAFLFYGLVVAAAGWLFSCRRLLGVIGLFIGGFAMLAVMLVNAAALALSVAFSDSSLDGGGVLDSGSSMDSVRSDIRVALLLGLLVVVAAAFAHAYDGFVGFAVLAFLGATTLPVVAFYAWHTEHPLRWAFGFAVIAALGIVAMIGLQLDRRPPPPQQGYAGQPMDHNPGDQHPDTIGR
jgi:hypothetical protein